MGHDGRGHVTRKEAQRGRLVEAVVQRQSWLRVTKKIGPQETDRMSHLCWP